MDLATKEAKVRAVLVPPSRVGGHPAKARVVIMAALTRETVLRFLVLVIFVVVSSVTVITRDQAPSQSVLNSK